MGVCLWGEIVDSMYEYLSDAIKERMMEKMRSPFCHEQPFTFVFI